MIEQLEPPTGAVAGRPARAPPSTTTAVVDGLRRGGLRTVSFFLFLTPPLGKTGGRSVLSLVFGQTIHSRVRQESVVLAEEMITRRMPVRAKMSTHSGLR